MSRKFTLLLLIMLAGFASAAWGENEQKCGSTAEECERQIRSMLAGKKYLGFTVVAGSGGIGLFVKSVAEDSPAERAGLRAGDRIMTLGNHDVSKARLSDLRKMRAEWLSSHPEKPGDDRIVMTINRYGAFKRLTLRAERMTKTQIDKVVAAHLAAAHGVEGSH